MAKNSGYNIHCFDVMPIFPNWCPSYTVHTSPYFHTFHTFSAVEQFLRNPFFDFALPFNASGYPFKWISKPFTIRLQTIYFYLFNGKALVYEIHVPSHIYDVH